MITETATCKFCVEGDGFQRGRVMSYTDLGSFHESCERDAKRAAAAQTAQTDAVTVTPGWRLLVAKYPSRCPRCLGQILAGKRVEWLPGQSARHIGCTPTAPKTRTESVTRPTYTARRTSGGCPSYSRDQGCPLHGETCAR
ncbi:MAG TPA: hypothetical protein VNM48_10955 [Chloroflexota bacterium]|nr:hypothetical protein [Chloroflexota bacterium]